jgi:hypothetical protein
MSYSREQLELILLPSFNQDINSVIPAFRTERVVDFCAGKEQRFLQVLKMMLFQECWVCEAANFAGPIGEGIAHIGSPKAVSIYTVRIAVKVPSTA